MYIYKHCHLSNTDYEDIDSVILENRKNGIGKIIVSGCTEDSIIESIKFSEKYEDVYLTLGYHPSEVMVVTDFLLQQLEKQLCNNSKVVGIGEIGLDYHYGRETRDLQILLFEKQLKLAEKLHLPVVIHSRDATEDTISILEKYDISGVIHCFSGSIEVARRYLKMGFLLGIGGVVTFKNSRLFEVVKDVGLSAIVLETDSPYLTPDPYRGCKNSSKYIPIIAQRVADICDVAIDDVERYTNDNASKVFDLD